MSPVRTPQILLLVLALGPGLFWPMAHAETTLYLHPPDSQQLDFAALSEIIELETGITLRADPSDEAGDDPIASILDRSADLAVVENTLPFVDGVRTVLPLYQGVVHFSSNLKFDHQAFIDEGRRPRVEIVDNSYTAGLVADLIAERANYQGSRFLRWREGDPGEPDFQLYVGPINPQNTTWFRDGFTLVPIGAIDVAGAEFYLEGVKYLVPQLKTTRIPALTYSLPGNEQGIDALAVDMLLVARRSVEPSVIYSLVSTVLEEKARFAAVEPALFRWVSSRFENDGLAFPLHRGARRYLERDEPGFLERYAETLNFLVYLVVLLLSGLVALGRWRARRRKDRIDGFYLRALELRRQVGEVESQALLAELDALETEAFDGLVAERLAADDSFRIFTELTNGLRRELRERLSTA